MATTTKTPSKPHDGDPRFHEYADALRGGDLETCERLRTEHRRDREIITKFDTVERIWLAEMPRMVREIQILIRERDGWKQIAEGGANKQRRGKKYLEQAEEARHEHEEVPVPLFFDGVK